LPQYARDTQQHLNSTRGGRPKVPGSAGVYGISGESNDDVFRLIARFSMDACQSSVRRKVSEIAISLTLGG
jgi:hypothetical protein